MYIYSKGEDERPGNYILLMEQVQVLINTENKVSELYQTFFEFARI